MNASLRPAPFPPTMAIQTDPARFTALRHVAINEPLARSLGLSSDWLKSDEGLAFLGGQTRLNDVAPVAQAYAGHQFGQFVPQLGDGRAHLLGVLTDSDGQDRDIQLKGSGQTPFSRRGDGLAVLGPVLREYLVSEAMAALHVPTTRALSAVLTGETVWRDRPQPGAVLARVAASHLRVGTFQYFAARENTEAIRFLCDMAIARHYPAAQEAEHPVRVFYDGVVAAQARLIARWMSLGFIHGVMNTDNMAISGETIDYGPCAFLDSYSAGKVFSSIDRNGRYAYANQPKLAGWNLARLAETLLPLFDADEDRALAHAQSALSRFLPLYTAAYNDLMRKKLGLSEPHEDDPALITALLACMETHQLDWTLTFRRLARGESLCDTRPSGALPDDLASWTSRWQARRALDPLSEVEGRTLMLRSSPAVIPRNHRIAEAIEAAEQGDFTVFEALLARITRPFEDDTAYERPPEDFEIVRATFCGT